MPISKKICHKKHNLLKSVFFIIIFIRAFIVINNVYAENLQQIIDKAKTGSVITLKKGIYYGNIVINKPITLNGNNVAIIDGRGKGTVITVKSNSVILKNLIIQNSGENDYKLDAGIALYSSYNLIENNIIRDCYYGIQTKHANYNKIIGNNISSKNEDLELRGDGMRLWDSNYNLIQDNYVHHVRDFIIWYSMFDTIINQKTDDSRYGIHFMYSHYDTVINFEGNRDVVGIYLMYTDHILIRNSYIANCDVPTGIGVGFIETSNTLIENTTIRHCTRGAFINMTPFEPNSPVVFIGNGFLFNSVAMDFNTDITRKDNIFIMNNFIGNISDIHVTGGMPDHQRGIWRFNYWDKYIGFDWKNVGVGETPYNVYLYSDTLLNGFLGIEFFRGSPIIQILEFVNRLIPISQPLVILTDPFPVAHPFPKIRSEILNTIIKNPHINIPKKGGKIQEWVVQY